MKRVVRIERQGKRIDGSGSTQGTVVRPEEIDSTVALVQALIPLELHFVGKALEAEVVALACARYRRTGGRPGMVRWGQHPNSVYLADQTRSIQVPRVRDRVADRASPLTTYERLHVPRVCGCRLVSGRCWWA